MLTFVIPHWIARGGVVLSNLRSAFRSVGPASALLRYWKPSHIDDELASRSMNSHIGLPAIASHDQKGASPSQFALIGLGLNSYTNPNVTEGLRRTFSGHQIDWIDLGPLVMQRKLMPLL